MSQVKKVLELLQRRGAVGVHSFEGYQMRIPRLSARIHNLKEQGYVIETVRLPKNEVKYILK